MRHAPATTGGRYGDGLFLATAWGHQAYVHLFDHDGRHQRSITPCGSRTLDSELDALVAPLSGKVHGDIAVQLFQTEYEWVVFGLIDESGDRAGDGRHVDWVERYPDGLGLHEPWDGTAPTADRASALRVAAYGTGRGPRVSRRIDARTHRRALGKSGRAGLPH